MNANNRRLTGALLLGAVALLLLPWYSLEAGFFDSGWLLNLWRDEASAPALWQIGSHPWLALAVALLALCAACGLLPGSARSRLLLLFSALGVFFLIVEGHAIGYSGWSWLWLENRFGALPQGQPAMALARSCC